jgi:tRNA (guanine-N7-)-methyltransferase
MSTTDFPDAMNAPKPDAPFMRVIKTYVLRAGRMGPGQTRAFEQFGAKFLLPFKNEKLDLVASFGRQAPLILEIGFGMGDATAKIAQTRAGDNFYVL